MNFEEGLLELDASVRPQKHYPSLAPMTSSNFGNYPSPQHSPVTSPRGKLKKEKTNENVDARKTLDDVDYLARPRDTSRSKYDKAERGEREQRDKSEKDSEKRTGNVFKLQTGRLKIARRTSNDEVKDEKAQEGQGVVASPRHDGTEDPDKPFFSLFNFLSPRQLAEQLTVFDQRQFQRITKSDFGQVGKWSMAATPTVSNISEIFNLLNSAIQTEILSELTFYQRQKKFIYAVELMNELANLRNYHSLFSLNSAIHSQTIMRLEYLFTNLPTPYSDILTRCEEICSVGRSYENARNLVGECTRDHIAHIPWLGITQKNLVTLKESLKETGDQSGGTLLKEQYRALLAAVKGYCFPANPFVQIFIPRLWTLDPDSFFQVSRIVEKLDKSSGVIAHSMAIGKKFRKSNSESDVTNSGSRPLDSSTDGKALAQLGLQDNLQKIYASKVDYYAHTLPMLQSQLTRDLFRQNRKDCDLRILSTMSKEDVPTFCCLFELRCPRFFGALKKETFVTRRPGVSECPVPTQSSLISASTHVQGLAGPRLPLGDVKKLVTEDLVAPSAGSSSPRNHPTPPNQLQLSQGHKKRANTYEEKQSPPTASHTQPANTPAPLEKDSILLRERALSSPSMQSASSVNQPQPLSPRPQSQVLQHATPGKCASPLSGSTSELDRLTSDILPDRLPSLPQVPPLPTANANASGAAIESVASPRSGVGTRARRLAREATGHEKDFLPSLTVDSATPSPPLAATQQQLPHLPSLPPSTPEAIDPGQVPAWSLLGASRNTALPRPVSLQERGANSPSSNLRTVRELRREVSLKSEDPLTAPLTVKSKYNLRVIRVLIDFLFYDQINFDEFTRGERSLDFMELGHIELTGSVGTLAKQQETGAANSAMVSGAKGEDVDDLFGVWKISILYELPYLEKIIYTFLSDQLSHPLLGPKKMYSYMQACQKWEIDPKNLPEVALPPPTTSNPSSVHNSNSNRDRERESSKNSKEKGDHLSRIGSSAGSSGGNSGNNTPTSSMANLHAHLQASGANLPDSAEREGSVLGEKLFLHASSSTNYDFYKITTKESVDTKISLVDPSERVVEYKFNRIVVSNNCTFFAQILKSQEEVDVKDHVRVYLKRFTTPHPHAVIDAVIDIALHHGIPQAMQNHLSIPVVLYLFLSGNVFGFYCWDHIETYLAKILEDIPERGPQLRAIVREIGYKDESELTRLYNLYYDSVLVNSKYAILSVLREKLDDLQYLKSLIAKCTTELRVKNEQLTTQNSELKAEMAALRNEFETFKEQVYYLLVKQSNS